MLEVKELESINGIAVFQATGDRLDFDNFYPNPIIKNGRTAVIATCYEEGEKYPEKPFWEYVLFACYPFGYEGIEAGFDTRNGVTGLEVAKLLCNENFFAHVEDRSSLLKLGAVYIKFNPDFDTFDLELVTDTETSVEYKKILFNLRNLLDAVDSAILESTTSKCAKIAKSLYFEDENYCEKIGEATKNFEAYQNRFMKERR